ncbi:hypothetical protein NC974_26575, partial [Leptolyngbya sp. SLC-A1]
TDALAHLRPDNPQLVLAWALHSPNCNPSNYAPPSGLYITFAIEQPADVDVNEIIVRPIGQIS